MTRGILSVCHGPDSGKKVVLESGQTLRMGRTELADVIIRGDVQMSGVHFEIHWNGQECTLRDLESATGTLVGGQREQQACLAHGGWVRAGQTDFLFHVEDYTPPPENEETAPLETWDETDAKERALVRLGALAAQNLLYAVVDPTRAERILILLRESVDRCQSLYDGVEGLAMAEVAPYLVKIDADSNLLGRLVVEGLGKRWGIFLVAEIAFVEIRRQLRRLLMIEGPSGEPLYFRFYDPLVLAAFLPTCTPRQCGDVFGDLDTFLLEGAGGTLTAHSRFEPTSKSTNVMEQSL